MEKKFAVILNTTFSGKVVVEGVARIIRKLDGNMSRFKVNINGDVVERFIEERLMFKTQKQADAAYFAEKELLASKG